MRANRERCFEECELDEDDGCSALPRELVLPALWSELNASSLPGGLDSFCLDASIMCGVEVVKGWLEILTFRSARSSSGKLYLGRYDSELQELTGENAVRSVELLWRRRLRVDPGWKEHGPAWTNRVNRAKRRAMKMISREMELEPF